MNSIVVIHRSSQRGEHKHIFHKQPIGVRWFKFFAQAIIVLKFLSFDGRSWGTYMDGRHNRISTNELASNFAIQLEQPVYSS